MIVLKFGGTSLSTIDTVKTIANIVEQNQPCIVVVSAVSGVTNKLIELCKRIQISADTHELIDEIHHTYNDLSIKLSGIKIEINRELRTLVNAIDNIGDFTETIRTKIISLGEVWSSVMINHYLDTLSIRNQIIDAKKVIIKENDAFNVKTELIEEELRSNNVLITQGFIYSENGKPKLMERGGSDYSASLIASEMNSEQLQIWTDVNGVYSADPRVVSNAFSISSIGAIQVSQLAKYGAKILHPDTIKPALDKNIEVKVLNTFNPDFKGTVVTNEKTNINSVTVKKGLYRVKFKSQYPSDQIRDVFKLVQRKINIYEIFGSDEDLDVIIEPKNKVMLDLFDEINDGYAIVCITGSFIFDEYLSNLAIVIENNNEKNIHKMLIKETDSDIALNYIHRLFKYEQNSRLF